MIYATPSKILWSIVLLCVILLFMGCSGKWVDTEDLVGLDESLQRAIRTPSRIPSPLFGAIRSGSNSPRAINLNRSVGT